MAARPPSAHPPETREQRIEALLKELLPKVEQTVRQLVERAVEVREVLLGDAHRVRLVGDKDVDDPAFDLHAGRSDRGPSVLPRVRRSISSEVLT